LFFLFNSFFTIKGLLLGSKNVIFFFTIFSTTSIFSLILILPGFDFGFSIQSVIFLSTKDLSKIGFFNGIIDNSAAKLLDMITQKIINILIKNDIFLGINFTK